MTNGAKEIYAYEISFHLYILFHVCPIHSLGCSVIYFFTVKFYNNYVENYEKDNGTSQ